jgi:DNA repair photolyase
VTFIYTPQGKAYEFAHFALNDYWGCNGGCIYCYGPAFCHTTPERFHGHPYARKGLLEGLRKELPAFTGTTDPIMLSFICDPYQDLDIGLELTRQVLQEMVAHDVPFSILTKQGDRAPRDFDLMRRGRAKFGVTLTVQDEGQRVYWEPHCGTVQERVRAIMEAHREGIPTWVSLEPIIRPGDTIQFLEQLADVVDHFKVGRLNYHEHAKTIDWPGTKELVIEKVKELGIENKVYIKESLRNL